jgi:hypothetical protein
MSSELGIDLLVACLPDSPWPSTVGMRILGVPKWQARETTPRRRSQIAVQQNTQVVEFKSLAIQ